MVILKATISFKNGEYIISPIDSSISTEQFLRFASKEKLSECCSICVDQLVSEELSEVSFFRCGHFMHTTCIDNYLKFIQDPNLFVCPFCRTSLNKNCIDLLNDAFLSKDENDIIFSLKSVEEENFFNLESIDFTEIEIEKMVGWLKSDNIELLQAFLPLFLKILTNDFFNKYWIYFYEKISLTFFLDKIECLFEQKNFTVTCFSVFHQYVNIFYNPEYNFLLFSGKRYSESFRFYKSLLKNIYKRTIILINKYKDKLVENRCYNVHLQCLHSIRKLIKSDLQYQNLVFFYREKLFPRAEELHYLQGDDKKSLDLFVKLMNEKDFRCLPDYQIFFDKIFRSINEDTAYDFIPFFLNNYSFLLSEGYSNLFNFDYIEKLAILPHLCLCLLVCWLSLLEYGYTHEICIRDDIKERIDLVFDRISQHIGEDNYVLFDTIYDVVNYFQDDN